MSQDNVNELISALLDGELAPDEQTRVEELLLDSAAHRQTFKEMRTLRDHLQSLPKYTVDGEFVNSVLQQIEQRNLAPENRADSARASEQEHEERDEILPASRNASDSPRGVKRGLAWAALAIAASVLIFLIYGPLNQQPPREAADVRDTSSGNEPGKKVSQDKSQLKDIDRAEPGKLAAKQLADSVEEQLVRSADPAEKAPAPGPDTIHAPKDSVAVKEFAKQRLAAEAGKTDQPGLLPAGAFGGGSDNSGSIDLYYVVDIPSDTVASEIVDATLVENGIAMVDLQDQLATRRRTRGRSQIESTADRFADVDVRDLARGLSLQNDTKGESKKNLDELATSEILVLNATPQQINKTLASLKARGYQWESRQQLDSDAEWFFEGKSQAGGEKQLGLPLRSVAESDNLQAGDKAASRRPEAGAAKVNAPKDPSKPETPLEEVAKRKLPGAPVPPEIAGSPSSNRAASGPAIGQASDNKNEIGKPTDTEGARTPSANFAKSAGNKANDGRQQASRSYAYAYAYRLKAPSKQDSGGVLAREKKEESPTAPSFRSTARPDSAVKDRANKSKPQPQPDGGGEGESAQTADGLDVAEAKPAATEDAPLVRAIIILRSVPAVPRAAAQEATP